MDTHTDLVNKLNEHQHLLHDLKTYALVAIIIAVIAVTGMFLALALNIKNNNTLRQARESQLIYFERTDKMLKNQIYFKNEVDKCLKLLESHNDILTNEIKPILQNIKRAADSYERRIQNIKNKQGNSTNKISINTPESDRISRLEKTIELLFKRE